MIGANVIGGKHHARRHLSRRDISRGARVLTVPYDVSLRSFEIGGENFYFRIIMYLVTYVFDLYD